MRKVLVTFLITAMVIMVGVAVSTFSTGQLGSTAWADEGGE